MLHPFASLKFVYHSSFKFVYLVNQSRCTTDSIKSFLLCSMEGPPPHHSVLRNIISKSFFTVEVSLSMS